MSLEKNLEDNPQNASSIDAIGHDNVKLGGSQNASSIEVIGHDGVNLGEPKTNPALETIEQAAGVPLENLAAKTNPTLETIEQVGSGWINKYELTYRLPDGSPFVYEVASRKALEDYQALVSNPGSYKLTIESDGASADAVSIVGITPEKSLLMIREFRYTVNDWCVSFPAGLVERGEDLRECADRELREETGYGLVPNSQIRPMRQAGLSSTGLSDEAVRIVFAEVAKVADAHPEPNEMIEAFELPIDHIDDFLANNEMPLGTRVQLTLMIVSLAHKLRLRETN